MSTVEKLFNSLKIPGDVFNPVKELNKRVGDWNVILSSRARGKTTNLLLWGMCANWTNGTIIQYIRQYDDMLTPSMIQDLFKVILEHDYISTITGGQYNSCKYYRRRWYYTLTDESGEEIQRAEKPFMNCLAINREHDLRSTYNCPEGDFIIVDEFMRADKMYIRDEFILLNNLLSTIIRDRTTARIFLLANLVDVTCPYLVEMGIHEIVSKMNFGDFKQITIDNTVLSIYLIPQPPAKNKRKNKYFSLWQNNRLTGITGAKGTWALKIYPHAPHDEFKIIDRAQIHCRDGYICREIRQYSNGFYVMFYPLIEPLPDKVTYTYDDSEPFDIMRRYGMGGDTLTEKLVIYLINRRKWYFSDNTTGERVTQFLKNKVY